MEVRPLAPGAHGRDVGRDSGLVTASLPVLPVTDDPQVLKCLQRVRMLSAPLEQIKAN